MKMERKGFTLIELLAVIVILAIIALIAVPVIMNIIANARKSAAADSAYSIINAGKLYYANELLVHPAESFETTVFSWETLDPIEKDGNTLEIKGTKPEGGKITINEDGRVLITEALIIKGFSCNYKTGSDTEIECDEMS